MKLTRFSTKEDAVKVFAQKAIPMTDSTNKEHAAVIFKAKDGYCCTKIDKGFHTTVWPTALKYVFIRKEKYFLHTHPNNGRLNANGKFKDNNPFSGVPGSRKLKDAGDAYVVDVLGYAGIYLISAMGNAYLYEGIAGSAQSNTYASNKKELSSLKPVISGLTRSKYCYKKAKNSKKHFASYEKEPWMPD